MSDAARHPTRRQFSLRTLLVALVIVALGLGLWRSGLETAALRSELARVRADTEKELQRWRAEAGALDVQDRSKLHAIQIETFEDLTWKWRVFVPEGCRFLVGSQCNRIPKDEIPGACGPVLLPGESVVWIALRRNPQSGEWECRVTGSGGSMRSTIEPQDSAWIEKSGGSLTTGVGREAAISPADEPLVLLRHRVFEPGLLRAPPDPEPPLTGGVMVWLQPWKRAGDDR